MRRHSRSPRRTDRDRGGDRDRYRDQNDRDRDRGRGRDRDRKRTPSPKRKRSRSRTRSPIIRGPSGVKSKNYVNELLLTEQNDEMAKVMGFGGFNASRLDGKEESSFNPKGFADDKGWGNSSGFRKIEYSGGFGTNRGGGFKSDRGRGNRGFRNSGPDRGFGQKSESFGENRSFRGVRGRAMRGQSDRGRGARDGHSWHSKRDDDQSWREKRNWNEEKLEKYRPKEEEKPGMQLINPTHVPRGGYFEHDNRDGSPVADRRYSHSQVGRRYDDERDRNRGGGKMYDPRKDFRASHRSIRDRLTAPSKDRKDTYGWSGYGYPYEKSERDRNRNYKKPDFFDSRRKADSPERWYHDKFDELEQEDRSAKTLELVEKDVAHEEGPSHECEE